MSPHTEEPVIVLGGGLAGYSAAYEAAERGARVLLVEKAPEPGGSTVRSGGSFAFAGTDLQAAQGIEDNPELLRQDLLQGGGSQTDPELVELYVSHQIEAYEWLRRLGVEFHEVTLSGNQSAPRSHGVDIRRTFDTLRTAVNARTEVTELLSTTTERLLIKDGRVTGVVTRDVDGTVTERPGRGIILATGGFARGERAIATFAPSLVNARRMGGEYNTGDGLYLAMSAGADLADIGGVKGTFGVTADVPGMPRTPTLLNSLYRGGIAVNTSAQRFVDESISYKLISGFCLAQPGGIGIQIFDHKVMEQTISDKLVNNYRGALERGYVWRGHSLRDVAVAAGLDPQALTTTVAQYNEAVKTGHDPAFGRTHLSGGYGELALIDTAPFYAFPSTGGLTSTYGGLRVDAAMRVAHVLGGIVPGLYAAGEIVGGFHGNAYMSGSSLGKSLIFGRVAAASALGMPRPA